MTHLLYDPDVPLPLKRTFNGVKVGFMGLYDLGFPPMDDEWIIAEGHHEHAAFIEAANQLREQERGAAPGARPYGPESSPVHLWAVNLAKCDDLYDCPNPICQKWGSWQLYADWFALWTDGDNAFTADTPGAQPVTVMNPWDYTPAYREAAEKAHREWEAANPPMAFDANGNLTPGERQ